MSQTVRHGSCLCESIQFTVKGEPEKVLLCYCRDCSKNAGGPYQISAKFHATTVKIAKGEDLLRQFTIAKTNSGFEKHKIFCKACGCTLWTIPMSHAGEKYIVRTSLLDGGSVMRVL
ncbi:hypothetical protein L207DRAFT_595191 [Hyaloscypha variabilis F]|uniref:CENP-V/GFA domain-containing protein n=1 Tax=Hyaloscypha variabilis (strain UAMH 11265 / GT02V1 / F) TaxID=1149755 RepID=A0A2J6SDD4_HYAVF|nr:hypothetical protein L207DRAFT_595191 [Hyaloscypha variabilis F]